MRKTFKCYHVARWAFQRNALFFSKKTESCTRRSGPHFLFSILFIRTLHTHDRQQKHSKRLWRCAPSEGPSDRTPLRRHIPVDCCDGLNISSQDSYIRRRDLIQRTKRSVSPRWRTESSLEEKDYPAPRRRDKREGDLPTPDNPAPGRRGKESSSSRMGEKYASHHTADFEEYFGPTGRTSFSSALWFWGGWPRAITLSRPLNCLLIRV